MGSCTVTVHAIAYDTVLGIIWYARCISWIRRYTGNKAYNGVPGNVAQVQRLIFLVYYWTDILCK
jgi:hypothetical protein